MFPYKCILKNIYYIFHHFQVLSRLEAKKKELKEREKQLRLKTKQELKSDIESLKSVIDMMKRKEEVEKKIGRDTCRIDGEVRRVG